MEISWFFPQSTQGLEQNSKMRTNFIWKYQKGVDV
jgi:hypothetical protein